MKNYILWDQSAELFSLGRFTLRWNGVLLILAFVLARQIFILLYKGKGKPAKDVDPLIAYLTLGTAIGARLGHVIFFQPQLWSKPLAAFLPIELKPSFHFTGMTGFSIHGAVIGILLAAWLYARRKQITITYLQVLDWVSIPLTVIAMLIFAGSFLNSESDGKPTRLAVGTVFVQPITEGIRQLPCCVMRSPGGPNPLTQVTAVRDKQVVENDNGHHSVAFYLFFKPGTQMQVVDEFMVGDIKNYLYDHSQTVYEPGTQPLHYAVFKEKDDNFAARVRTIGVARFPVQLFEATTSLMLVIFLLWYWRRHKSNLTPGLVFGYCMTIFWTLHFVFEFIREDQKSFMKGMALNKAQILSIPLLILGVYILLKALKVKKIQ